MKKVIFILLPAFVSLLCSCGFNNNDDAGLKSGAVTIDSLLETVDEDSCNIERIANNVQDTSISIQLGSPGWQYIYY